MKIAIMTWFHQDNYGTVLQAAALCRTLRARGHEVDIIRYFPKEQVNTLPGRNARRQIVRSLRAQRQEAKNPRIVSERAGETFQTFRDTYMSFTDYYSTMTDLESLNDKYDAFICGSDLIWLPRYFDPHYYLDFVKDTNTMIAYAPSLLDDDEADRAVLNQMGDLIRRFKHLSVREDSGRRVLSETYQIQTEEVADPVLLLSPEDWELFLEEGGEGEVPEEPAVTEETAEAEPENTEAAGSEAEAENAETAEADAKGAEAVDAETKEEETAAAETKAETAGEAKAAVTEAADAVEMSDAAQTAAPNESSEKEAAGENSASDKAETAKEEAAAEAEGLTVQAGETQPAEVPGDPEPTGTLLVCLQGKHFMYWEAADKLAARLNLRLQIVPIYQDDLKREGCIKEPVSPLHFVRLLKDADYICTDSYHATVLSVLFKKNFCCFERYTERTEQERNARIRHILDAVGLKSRIYDAEAPLENYLEEIDWIPVNYKLDALRIKSDKYLNEALRAVEEHRGRERSRSRHVLDEYSLCTGCGACEAVCEEGAVTVELDVAGFYTAKVDESLCKQCGRCSQVCTMREELYGRRVASGRLLSYTDEESDLQRSAAAGGISSRLALILHEQGLAVAGCVYDEETQRAKHRLVTPEEPAEALSAFRGNKYMQSDLRELWAQLAEYEGPAVVFGTPCQIAALRSALRSREQIFYIEGVCSGVPSSLLHAKYRKSMQQRRNLLHWRAPRADTFDRMLRLDECSMQACYECRWRDISDADLRIGDLRSDFPGRRGSAEGNVVISLTENGNELLNRLMNAGYWEGLKKEDIAAYVASHKEENPIRPIFYDELIRKLGDERIGMRKLVNEYVKPYEKRYSLNLHSSMFYSVSGDASTGTYRLPEMDTPKPHDLSLVIRRRQEPEAGEQVQAGTDTDPSDSIQSQPEASAAAKAEAAEPQPEAVSFGGTEAPQESDSEA